MFAIIDLLQRRRDAGEWSLGEVLVRPDLSLRHRADGGTPNLEVFSRPEAARDIARYDAGGDYRPLKTAPNLRRGWALHLSDLEALRLALDFFYPAALGTWLAFEQGRLSAVPLRATLGRQTGMYRAAQNIRDDQAATVIGKTCGEGCLRSRLWGIDASMVPAMSDPHARSEVPVLCAEACNLLVAACRSVAKSNLPKAEQT